VGSKKFSAIYYLMEKKALLFKTLLVETENKEESFITEHPNSQSSTDYRPVAEIIFPKIKGVQKEITIDIEDFIAVKDLKH
jgi:topoisomerase-4 subunit A